MTVGPPVVMVDLDGTIMDNSRRHAHFFPPGENNQWTDDRWSEYDLACETDPPIAHMVEVVRSLSQSYDIVLITGRHDIAMQQTIDWMQQWDIDFVDLLMRSPGDKRSNPDLKVGMHELITAEGRDIHLIIDDHPGVIARFQELGVATLHVSHPTNPHAVEGHSF